MDKTMTKLQEILLDSLSFQYSSAASLYILDGQRPPKKFGSNCYEQARSLRNTLMQCGFNQTYYIEDALQRRHRGVLCCIKEKRFYFDPYLMHPEPIEVDHKPFTRTYNSYPTVQGEQSKLSISHRHNKLHVAKRWPGQSQIHTFAFDLHSLITTDITFDDYLQRTFHPEQTTLSIRFLNVTTKAVDRLVYPLDQTKHGIFIKTNEGIDIPSSDVLVFQKKLRALTPLISSNSQEVLDFIEGAAALHKQFSKTPPSNSGKSVPSPYF